jgi:multidrug resistance efflux pump
MLETSKITAQIDRADPQITPRSLLSNALIVLISAGLLVWAVRLMHTKMTSVISRDAVINGIVVDINAPMEGEISELSLASGAQIEKDKPVIALKNDKISELGPQGIRTRINNAQAQIQRIQGQLESRMALRQRWEGEEVSHQSLRVERGDRSLQQIEAELRAAQSQLTVAERNYDRIASLVKQDVLPKARLDEVEMEKEQMAGEVQSLQARLERSQVEQSSFQRDVSLDSSNNYQPKYRLQDIDLEIRNLELELKTVQQELQDAQQELVKATTDVKNNQARVVQTPVAGVVWKLNSQKGQYVQKGANLGQVLDCSQRWVDVFVDEQALRDITPGMVASIELYGAASQTLEGKVSTIRSGVGRLQAGQDVAVPIAPNMPRTTQVRVEIEQSAEKGDPKSMCYVGYTGKVSFKR